MRRGDFERFWKWWGGRITLPEQQDTDADEKVLRHVEMGGGEAIIVDDFEEVVEEERLELRAGTSSMGGESMNELRKTGFSGAGSYEGVDFGQASVGI